jgi:D-3-phosphoglycerate dehydrogenase
MARVLITDQNYEDLALERELFSSAGMELAVAQCATEDEVLAAGRNFDAFLVQYAPIGARALAQLPRLGVISRIGAGYDTIDTDACAKHGVWLANSPDYGVGEVATHALALGLALIRNVVAYNRDIAGGRWHYLSSGRLRRASELTLGIVGLGRIGKRMAHVSRNVFRRVDGDFPAYVERATLADLFEQSDLVSLHVPLNDETRSIVDATMLSRMRPGSYLVNTARGALVEEAALIAALQSGQIAHAGLDVFHAEPLDRAHPLARMENVTLSAHAAFRTLEASLTLMRRAVDIVRKIVGMSPVSPAPV